MRNSVVAALLAVAFASFATPSLAFEGSEASLLAAKREGMVRDLAGLRFDRLGNPVLRWDHIPPVQAPRDRPHQLLVVLVDFPDVHFDRFAGDSEQGDKLASFYQELLFDPSYSRPGTLSHYYANQSLGRYHLQGTVLPPFELSKPRSSYGMPIKPSGGSWRNDADSEGLVEEVLAGVQAAHPDLDWASFDQWDPRDYDGDGILAERDGYLDHFVIVYAGGGQSSCQRLYKLDDQLNPNVGPEVLGMLSAEARECADRIWPHRFMVQKREGSGPRVEGFVNARGGVPMKSGLWGRDYNMQSEYTEQSTFIHEFGHSLGLPDIYARTSTNSTGGWEVMSATTSPLPQSLSAWSRMMLGWLEPVVVLPPAFGGRDVQSTYLRVLDDPGTDASETASRKAGIGRAMMVVLPPKVREVDLGALPKASGQRALYSGQGNELERSVELRLDLRGSEGPVSLAFDAWWDIEAGWDFAYLETTIDGGATWQRRVTDDVRFMPAKHGHDGADTLPGFTGLSGDEDGDGKNEHAKGCDPKKKVEHGEDRAGAGQDPCVVPGWARPRFVLDGVAGHEARVRLRYFTDMAAVQRGILIDNVAVEVGEGKAVKSLFSEDFEGDLDPRVKLAGFTVSEGRHTLLVPHFYVVELRDPYAKVEGHRYDSALTDPIWAFFEDPRGGLKAMAIRNRPGVVVWYYDGAYAWSENDPALNGQGQGFLLALDAWPNEVALPGWDQWLHGKSDTFDTRYELEAPEVQSLLEKGFLQTMCFVRNAGYRPQDLGERVATACSSDKAAAESLEVNGKPLMYSYERYNRLLPGPERDAYETASELLDYKVRDGKVTWRLRDTSLRYLHSMDAPFALEPFEDHVRLFDVKDGALVPTGSRAASAVSTFDASRPQRWVNPKLLFGGVKVPPVPLQVELAKPAADAPKDARVKVYVRW